MPNHVTNIVTCEGSPEVLKSLLNADGDVDFNAVVPMPEGYKDFQPHCGIEDRCLAALGLAGNPGENLSGMDAVIARLKFHNIARDISTPASREDVQMVITALSLWLNHGHLYWYPWSLEHWGTKWNAYSQTIEDESLRFDTAWSTPKKIFMALSAKHPEHEIKVSFADEDFGANCGVLTLKGGEIISEWLPEAYTFEARQFAFNVRWPGEDPADHEMDENFEYIEDEDEDEVA